MRRGAGLAFITLGLFLVVLAGAVRYWAYDRMVLLPTNLYMSIDVPGRATYLDTKTLKERTGDVVARQTIRADTKASTGNVAVVDLSRVVTTKSGLLLQASVERSALDRRTGLAVNCCNESVDGKPIAHTGYTVKFPFNTEKREYSLWDSTGKQAYTAWFDGVETIDGRQLYKFVQDIPAHQIRIEPNIGALVGEARTYDVPVWNTGRTTYWVEPVTGTPLVEKIETKSTLRNSRNQDKVRVFDGVLNMNGLNGPPAAGIDKNIERINLLHTRLPYGSLLAGALALLFGALLVKRPRRTFAGYRRGVGIQPATNVATPATASRRDDRTPSTADLPGLGDTTIVAPIQPPVPPVEPVRRPVPVQRPVPVRRPVPVGVRTGPRHAAPSDDDDEYAQPPYADQAPRNRPRHPQGPTGVHPPGRYEQPPPGVPARPAEPPRRPERPAARQLAENPSGAHPRPERFVEHPSGEHARPYAERPSGEHARPWYVEHPSGLNSLPPFAERPSGEHQRPFIERPSGEHPHPFTERPTGDHPRPARFAEHPSGEHHRPTRFAEHPSGENGLPPFAEPPPTDRPSGALRRLTGDLPPIVEDEADPDGWFATIRPSGLGEHGRLDPSEWSPQTREDRH